MMKRTLQFAAVIVIIAANLHLFAQSPPPVPVPSQFATAKTAFLASAGSSAVSIREKDVSSMIYTSMYRFLASAKMYQLTTAPADAELSMALSLESVVTSVTNGSSFGYTFIRLSVVDTKTHSLLWNIDEPINGAFREKTFLKNVDDATSRVMADLKSLASGKIPVDTAANETPGTIDTTPTKKRFSQDKP
jgi:hypothetical protein